MKNWFKTHWPLFVHFGAAGAAFLDPAVKAYIASHLAYAVPLGALWAEIMRWSQAPGQNPASKF